MYQKIWGKIMNLFFNDFSIEDFEYIIEILYRCERADDDIRVL